MKLGRLVKAANAARLTTTLLALWKLFRHPQTPWVVKLIAVVVIAYAVSPIDLIADFVPVFGQLDDLVIIPLGVALAMRLTPRPLWEARLAEAQASADKLPRLWWGAAAVLAAWAALLALAVWWLWGAYAPA